MAMLRARPANQFRLRTLTLLVLLAGVASGTERAWRRRHESLNRAAYHAAEEAKLSAEATVLAAEFARLRRLLNRSCGNPWRYAEAMKSLMTNCASELRSTDVGRNGTSGRPHAPGVRARG